MFSLPGAWGHSTLVTRKRVSAFHPHDYMNIDVSFDFRIDTPEGGDPDIRSPTLRRYHRHLWSKVLPDGAPFELVMSTPQAYLHHRSAKGEFVLSSDSVIPTFTRAARIAHITQRIPADERAEFNRRAYTIGAMMVFPANRVGGKMTINGARGCHPRIKDRFDLTVECIQRHYLGADSPLVDVVARYTAFFSLFRDFRGYVDFFHLQDLVTADYSAVRHFLPFDGFHPWPLPDSDDAYRVYKRNAEAFIAKRNSRIAQHVLGHDRCGIS